MDDSTRILKTCNKCGGSFPLNNFYIKANAPDGRDYKCKTCAKAYRRKHYTDNPNYYKEYYETTGRYVHLHRNYGVDAEQYNRMINEQGGVCAICESPPPELRPLHLDHDHITGKPRGLLCAKCNSMLTHFGDRPEGLLRVLDYVQRGE